METTERKRGERGRQAKPTRAEVKQAWGHLRAAAEAGNLEACAALVALSQAQ